MLASVPGPITTWLSRWRSGAPDALEHIIPLVYDELRGVARRQLNREPIPNALSATTLVHETYLRLLQQRQVEAHDRSSFLAVAGCAMRRVLVDQARRRKSQKRGGRDQLVSSTARARASFATTTPIRCSMWTACSSGSRRSILAPLALSSAGSSPA